MRRSREISLVPSLHRASTDALIMLMMCSELDVDARRQSAMYSGVTFGSKSVWHSKKC